MMAAPRSAIVLRLAATDSISQSFTPTNTRSAVSISRIVSAVLILGMCRFPRGLVIFSPAWRSAARRGPPPSAKIASDPTRPKNYNPHFDSFTFCYRTCLCGCHVDLEPLRNIGGGITAKSPVDVFGDIADVRRREDVLQPAG